MTRDTTAGHEGRADHAGPEENVEEAELRDLSEEFIDLLSGLDDLELVAAALRIAGDIHLRERLDLLHQQVHAGEDA